MECEMTLKNFLKMYYGCMFRSDSKCEPCYVSIKQMYYDFITHKHEKKVYFEKKIKEDILSSDIFNDISNKQVDYFCIIGSISEVELRIHLKDEERNKV